MMYWVLPGFHRRFGLGLLAWREHRYVVEAKAGDVWGRPAADHDVAELALPDLGQAGQQLAVGHQQAGIR